jgi:hypothetical protein
VNGKGIKLRMERTGNYYLSNISAVSLSAVCPQKVGKRIFSKSDWDYLVREPAAIRHLFIRERRALALKWLRLIRHAAALIVFSYRINCPNLSSSDRLKLMGNYALFMSVWAALLFTVRCSNPIHSSLLATLALSQLERVSHCFPPLTARYSLSDVQEWKISSGTTKFLT